MALRRDGDFARARPPAAAGARPPRATAAAALDRFSRGTRGRPVVSRDGRERPRVLRLAGGGAGGHGPPWTHAARAADRARVARGAGAAGAGAAAQEAIRGPRRGAPG